MNCAACGYEFDPSNGLACPRCGEQLDCSGMTCEECGACSGLTRGVRTWLRGEGGDD